MNLEQENFENANFLWLLVELAPPSGSAYISKAEGGGWGWGG